MFDLYLPRDDSELDATPTNSEHWRDHLASWAPVNMHVVGREARKVFSVCWVVVPPTRICFPISLHHPLHLTQISMTLSGESVLESTMKYQPNIARVMQA